MPSPDCLRTRLEQKIDLNHPLAVLSTRLTWALIEAAVAPQLAPQAKAPKRVMGEALVGRWAEYVVWQLSSGMEYYEPRMTMRGHSNRPMPKKVKPLVTAVVVMPTPNRSSGCAKPSKANPPSSRW